MQSERRWWIGAVAGLIGAIGCGGKLNIVGGLNEAGSPSGPGAGGAGGASGASGGTVGKGGDGKVHPGKVVAQGLSLVTDVAADGTTLYWVEHGSEDELGNYLNDGRLMARDLVSGEVRALADDLSGPIRLGLTDSHVYVYLDQLYQAGDPNSLARLPIAGGDLENMLSGATPWGSFGSICRACFVHDSGVAYFFNKDTIYRARPQDDAPTPFAELDVISLALDDGAIYANAHSGFWKVPLDTAEPELISTEHLYEVQAAGDFAYWLEFENPPLYLMRSPLDGAGQSVRLPPGHPEAGRAWRLQLQDGVFFHDVLFYRDGEKNDAWGIVQGRLTEPGNAQYALELPGEARGNPWVGTTTGIFWSEGTTIRHVSNPVE